tara:strand:- start:2291 stop:2719 length:429 start_codon:yes stop_codon:yes gene_type:complete
MKPNITIKLRYKENKDKNIIEGINEEEYCDHFCDEICREFSLDKIILEEEQDDEHLIMSNVEDYYNMLEIYDSEYTKKEIIRIVEYYKLSKRKKKKNELIDDIVNFELDVSNQEIVERRKRLWGYIEEIKIDEYLSKYLILD